MPFARSSLDVNFCSAAAPAINSKSGISAHASNLPQVDSEEVSIGLPIGEGAFCRVYEASWTGCYSACPRQNGSSGAFSPFRQSHLATSGAQQGAIRVAVKVLKAQKGCPASALHTAGQRLACEGQLLWNLQHRYDYMLLLGVQIGG
jgi:hypothetical protein